jgi:threonylcarbamoyladenosine tRNA methylthiotransferase MtaB
MILKRMKRRHLRKDTVEFCHAIREIRPDITFGADIIAGFPTETNEMFYNSVRLVKECEFTWLHVFPYSARQGTPASRMPKISDVTIRERARELRIVGEKQVEVHLNKLQGSTQNVLVEKNQKGRTENFTQVNFLIDQPVGEIIPTMITGIIGSQLTGKPILTL